jgi:hypothetical protein
LCETGGTETAGLKGEWRDRAIEAKEREPARSNPTHAPAGAETAQSKPTGSQVDGKKRAIEAIPARTAGLTSMVLAGLSPNEANFGSQHRLPILQGSDQTKPSVKTADDGCGPAGESTERSQFWQPSPREGGGPRGSRAGPGMGAGTSVIHHEVEPAR